MAALASIDDLTARIGTLTDVQAARAPALLADASAMVRRFISRKVTTVVDDSVVLYPEGHRLRLPQRPVNAVTSVARIDGATDVVLVGWGWDGAELIDLELVATDGGDLPPHYPRHNTNTYRVVYSHGHAADSEDIDDLVAKVCHMVGRVLTAPTLADGMVSENIGQYGYTLQQSGGSQGAGVRLTAADKQDLIDAGWRRQSATITVRSW